MEVQSRPINICNDKDIIVLWEFPAAKRTRPVSVWCLSPVIYGYQIHACYSLTVAVAGALLLSWYWNGIIWVWVICFGSVPLPYPCCSPDSLLRPDNLLLLAGTSSRVYTPAPCHAAIRNLSPHRCNNDKPFTLYEKTHLEFDCSGQNCLDKDSTNLQLETLTPKDLLWFSLFFICSSQMRCDVFLNSRISNPSLVDCAFSRISNKDVFPFFVSTFLLFSLRFLYLFGTLFNIFIFQLYLLVSSFFFQRNFCSEWKQKRLLTIIFLFCISHFCLLFYSTLKKYIHI